jgi:four helix bundle protein
MPYRSFEDLDVWQASVQMAIDVYKLLKGCKDFALRDQMTRSAISIASNIAEGAERNSYPDFIRFLHIAKGSAAELRTQLRIATSVGAVKVDGFHQLDDRLKKISSQLQRLTEALKSTNNVDVKRKT